MGELGDQIVAGFRQASLLDQLNLVFGLAGVLLMIRRNLLAFPVSLLAVGIQGVLFFRETFYADALLQVFFFGVLVWGWRHWLHGGEGGGELTVTRLSGRGWVAVLGLIAAGTAAWAVPAAMWTDSRMPWRDAFLAAAGASGQVLQARKQLACWPVYAVANAVAVGAYWAAGMAFTTLLFLVYLGLSFWGWFSWRRAEWKQHER